MDDLRVSFPVLDANEGRTSLDARSFRQRALALATGKMRRHLTQEPVYVVAPERRSWLVPMLLVVIVAAGIGALLVWLL